MQLYASSIIYYLSTVSICQWREEGSFFTEYHPTYVLNENSSLLHIKMHKSYQKAKEKKGKNISDNENLNIYKHKH